jgi:hypothetical protein
MSTVRTYRELRRLDSFEERFEYLSLKGVVGESTFGFDRWVNQKFYASSEWKRIRDVVIVRDEGCDLGVRGWEIHGELLVHHMNPVSRLEITHGDSSIFDPDFLITTTHATHNAIHYGDARLLKRGPVERKPGDTKLW